MEAIMEVLPEPNRSGKLRDRINELKPVCPADISVLNIGASTRRSRILDVGALVLER